MLYGGLKMRTYLVSRPGWLRMAGRAGRSPLAVAGLTLILFCAAAGAQQAAPARGRHNPVLDTPNAQGLTPLIVAASAGQTETMQSLLVRGASVDATAVDGRTALIAAAQQNQLEAVKALVAAGANLNWAARGTGTALNVAENKGETQIAALLRAAGARTTGKSAGDTVCVRPWGGSGFCGTVQSFSVRAVQIQVTRIIGCASSCPAREDCSASLPVGGPNGLQAGDSIAVPSWCLTQTGVRP